ncbi:M56 family metallopeptidase [Hymenobacter antarcticus]|uniref:Peptidase M56 domain-containing protein n=1 Tax=Hymenobacter antarcticus TaxID=486270 RepID=A0ABP7PVA9_9BACT
MAASILLYLLKANAVLLLFAAAYFGLLRRLTFFSLNRFYLLFALLFAAVYPALPVPALLPAEAAPSLAFVLVAATAARPGAAAATASVDWATAGVGMYAVGTALMVGRLLWQLFSLGRVRQRSRAAVVAGQPVRVLPGALSPFSFGRSIYLNPDLHPGPELSAVLRHEQVHVRQWHTLDVLLAQLALAAAWCNPAAWLLRQALLDNLEYLADQAVLRAGLDRRTYQYSLLRLSHGASGPPLVSFFTFPTLKNRVKMMNTPLSSTGQLARYIVAGPLVLAIALGLSGARAQGAGPVVPAAKTTTSKGVSMPRLTYVDGRPYDQPLDKISPQTIARVDVVKGSQARQLFGEQAADGVILVTTKANQNRADVLALQNKIAATRPISLVPDALRRTVTMDAQQRTPAPVYYLDGQRQPGDLNRLQPADIASMQVFKGERCRQLFGETGGSGVIVITTKANQHRADVVEFNQKVGGAAYTPAGK